MRTTFHRGHARLPEHFHEHLETRLETALDRFRPRIGAIAVTVDDLNGPRGGEDMLCRLRVTLRGAGELIAETRGADLLECVDRAADQLRRSVSRAVERLRSRGRRTRRPD